MESNAVVEMEGVTFSYDDSPALEDVSIVLRERDFVSIVGPNGGGKTTLLKLMLGLLRPSKGNVRIFGKPPEEARSRIGYMPQDVQLDPRFPVTVMDVVLMGQLSSGSRFGYYSRSQKDAAVSALREVDLYDLWKRPLSSLSTGQKRRVLIARALASEPDLLLLDEPTANLDLLVEQELHALLKKLREKLTVIMVSHDLAFVSRYVDIVVCVNRVVAVHPTAEIDGELFSQMFGRDIKMVIHDQHFEHGHEG
jgi:zinc transport system ATP-binding protein